MLTTPTPAMEKVTVMGRVVKTIKGKDYLYEQHREGEKIRMKYIGPLEEIINVYIKSLDKTSSQEVLAGPEGFEPSTIDLEGKPFTKRFHPKAPMLTTLMITDFAKFREWLRTRRNQDDHTAESVMSYVTKQKYPVTPALFMKSYSVWLYKSFRLYVHYLYQMGYLTLEGRTRWLEILKLRSVYAPKEVIVTDQSIIDLLKANMPNDFNLALKICAYSGCRVVESVKLLTTECQSSTMPEFVRYELDWKRGKKSSAYIYLPLSLTVRKCNGLTAPSISGYIIRRSLLAPKMLRKFFYRIAKATALEERADPALADFYEGRVPKTIGERHYGDMLAEADKLYPKILSKLSTIISPSCS